MDEKEILEYGIEVFNNESEKFNRWLLKPNVSLNDKIPKELMKTEEGLILVELCLHRINYGIFS